MVAPDLSPSRSLAAIARERHGGQRGRPPMCTPELIERFAAAVRRGLFFDEAAALCEISRTTAHIWKSEGLKARVQLEQLMGGADVEPLTERQADYLDFLNAFEAAEAGDVDERIGRMTRAATPRQVRTVKVRQEPAKVKGEIQYDKDGNALMVTTREVTEKEEFDWRADEAVLKRRHARWRDSQDVHAELTGEGGGPILHGDITDLERRLGASIRPPTMDRYDEGIIDAEVISDRHVDMTLVPDTDEDPYYAFSLFVDDL